MCPACQAEYDNPVDRRFHAQPNACAACGPRVSLYDNSKNAVDGADPIAVAVALLKASRVLAVKGLGGHHSAADASNDKTVACLRKRKNREEKPLALMACDLETIRRFVKLAEADEKLLISIQRPIVLLNKKNPNPISKLVAPGNHCFGVMLPYTPLHYLLLQPCFTTLVMTSGNLSEESIAIDNQDAFRRLAAIADYFLIHDHDIYLRSDDSIVRPMAGAKRFMRRSRGYAPVAPKRDDIVTLI